MILFNQSLERNLADNFDEMKMFHCFVSVFHSRIVDHMEYGYGNI